MSEKQSMAVDAGAVARPAPVAAVPDESVRAVGAELTRLREQKGWSVNDVATRLKVPPVKLKALEAGDLSHLPDFTFAVGIVRSYARALGVDPAALVEALQRSGGGARQNLSLPAARTSALPRSPRAPLNWNGSRPKRRPWLWGVGAVILAFVALALYRTDREPVSWFTKLRASAPENASSAVATTGLALSGTATGTGESTSGAQALTAPMPAPLQRAGGQLFASAAEQTLAAVSSASAANPAAGLPSASIAGAAPAAVAGTVTLRFRMKQDSWVGVRQHDGKQAYSGVLRAGADQTVQAVPPLKVTVGNKAGLAGVEMDGKPVDPAKIDSARGNVARFTLP
jgi:cytoskeleton protein RodZ